MQLISCLTQNIIIRLLEFFKRKNAQPQLDKRQLKNAKPFTVYCFN